MMLKRGLGLVRFPKLSPLGDLNRQRVGQGTLFCYCSVLVYIGLSEMPALFLSPSLIQYRTVSSITFDLTADRIPGYFNGFPKKF